MGARAHPPDEQPGAVANRAAPPAPDAPAPKPRPLRWKRTLYAIFIAQMLAIVGFSLRAPFLPFFLQDLGATTTDEATIWSGLINAGGAGIMAITAPFWGVIADRYGRKPMVLRSMFAAACTVGLMALATAPWHLLALRLIEGALTGTVTASTALVASSAPKERLGYSLGLVQTAVFSGASLGPLFGGALADLIGYRATFAISSAMLASGGVIVIFFVEERFNRQARIARGPGGFRASTAWLLAPLMLTMIATLFVIRFASSSVQPIIPLYVQELARDTTRSTSTLAGLALGILGITSAVAAIYFGRLGDKIGHRKVLVWCAAGAGALYLPMAIVQAPWHLIVLQALFGVAAGGLMPTANALVGSATAPDRRGVLYGVTAAASSLGGFFGPLAGAASAAVVGFPVTFAGVGVILLGMTAWVARVFQRVEDPEP